MQAQSLPDKVARLSKICLVAGGIMTLILLCLACFMPNKYAHGVHPPPHKTHAVAGHDDGHKQHGDKHDSDAAHGHDHDAEKGHDKDDHSGDANEPQKAEGSNETEEVEGEAAGAGDGVDDGNTEAAAAAVDAGYIDLDADADAGDAEADADAVAEKDEKGADASEKKLHNVISRPWQEAWLIGWLFILAPTMGSFALLCITHLITGGWAFVIRRILEAAMKTCIPVLILFIPVVIPVIMHESFKANPESTLEQVTNYDEWLDQDHEDGHSIVATKLQYLDYGFFMVRLVIYFILFAFFTHIFYRWSKKQDETGHLKWRKKMKFWAGPCLLIYVLAMSFFAFDWMMSMEPEWFSSIYGVIWLIGQGVSTFAFCLVMVSWLAQASPIKDNLPADRLHNIGNLQFAFVIIWTYVNVAQFIIIWSANLPEETPWYLNRGFGMFQGLTVFLFLFQFVVPFLILLSRHTKRHTKTIALIAGWILFMRAIDIIWLIHPSVHGMEAARILGRTVPEYSAYHVLLAVFAIIAMGTLWFGLFLHNLKKLPFLPTRDPVFSPYYDYHDDLPGGANQ